MHAPQLGSGQHGGRLPRHATAIRASEVRMLVPAIVVWRREQSPTSS